VAIIPAVIVIMISGEENIDDLLVFSQVILSLQLGFAVIPLIHFVSDKKTMGIYAIKPFVQFLAWLIASILVYLNLRMLFEQASVFFASSDSLLWKSVIILAAVLFVGLLITAILYPLMRKKPQDVLVQVHQETVLPLEKLVVPGYRKIAVALDFSERDQKVLAHAVAQSGGESSIILIHIVESVSAKILGENSYDLETQKDKEKLDAYAAQLKELPPTLQKSWAWLSEFNC
jgi:manganese transport protein